ncbi:DUF962 domain-containing protein [Shewanella schlegeliana]|uniref:DUF962 domain-containing protein n=1 Tax=Shewanella schlegeliana TaxID=190308 RepID=A0ABS1SZW6_9GAMM|nr:DUF962 domain-containing protein [Shewanella schlegeliana]MBL4913444.1 DUF962 domain-containing protein [Shewanella schlegeliana]MCL1108334.1 DUF962 domain-containing protein [Shewanella schlegeliana]GIU34388.1 membrane protein [Shewanella schlegeliana]
MSKRYASFAEFYPFYLSQHQDKTCRALHYLGSTLVLLIFAYSLLSAQWWMLLALPVIGYGFAWVGHFAFEKNRPATFNYPLYSFLADWVMLYQALSRRKNI